VKRLLVAALLVVVCSSLAAQTPPASCAPKLSYDANGRFWAIDYLGCTTVPTFTPNTPITLYLGTTKYEGKVVRFFPADPDNVLNQSASVVFSLSGPGTSTADVIEAQYASNTAKIEYDGQTTTLTPAEPLNVRSQSFQFGPATSGDATGAGTNAAASQAFRYQLSFASSWRPAFASKPNSTFLSRLEKDFSLTVDSTDQKTGFVDNNNVSAGVYRPYIGITSLLAQGKIGGRVTYARAIHTDDHDLDAVGEVSGWLPFFQTINLMSKTTQRGSPLSIDLAYGWRSKRMASTPGQTFRGPTAQGSLGYHFYVLDNYRVDFNTTTVWSGLNDLPATTPRTQHSFKVQILYASSPTSRFNIATSIENGSFGPVLQKVRNYFIGVTLSQVFEQRAGGQ
jgi:hypothetical protein